MRSKLCPRFVGALALALLGAVAFAQTIVLIPSGTALNPAGGNLTFTASITYSTTPSTLGLSVGLPAGWTYVSSTSVTGTSPPEPSITPVAGRAGTLDWAFINVPASPLSFTFTTTYPSTATGLQQLTTSLVARDGSGGTPTQVTGPSLTLSGISTAIVWNGETGNWTDPAQWSPNTAPINAGAAHFSATVAGGVATLGAPITIDDLTFTGGTINGAGSLTLTGFASTWTAGVFAGVGELVIAPGAQLIASGNSTHGFSERTIRNQGTFAWLDNGNLQSGLGGQFINATGATFLDATTGSGDRLIANTSGGNFTFTNAGTFLKSNTGATLVSVPFANSGNVFVSAGTLRFSNTFTQSAGLVFVGAGATLRVDNGLSFNGGTLHGGGTVAADLTNGAVLSPGSPIGTLTVQGNLTLLGTSQLLFDLNTPVQGTGYDFLNVTGNATLGGSFSFQFLPGAEFGFTGGDSLTLLNAAALTGTFAGLPNGSRVTATHGIGSFVINYTATGVVLNQFLPIPEPSTWALLLSGLAVVAFTTLRRRR